MPSDSYLVGSLLKTVTKPCAQPFPVQAPHIALVSGPPQRSSVQRGLAALSPATPERTGKPNVDTNLSPIPPAAKPNGPVSVPPISVSGAQPTPENMQKIRQVYQQFRALEPEIKMALLSL